MCFLGDGGRLLDVCGSCSNSMAIALLSGAGSFAADSFALTLSALSASLALALRSSAGLMTSAHSRYSARGNKYNSRMNRPAPA